jgi:hypothetical protein
MAIFIANRALIAIRSLSKSEQTRVYAATRLIEDDLPSLIENGDLRLLGRGSSGSTYAMAVSSALRAVVSVREQDPDLVVLEDVVPDARIDHLSVGAA